MANPSVTSLPMRLRNSRSWYITDLSESTNLDAGFSLARGHNDVALIRRPEDFGVSRLYGIDAWPNFAARFGLEVDGYVEPKPGIPPSPRHTLDLINQMKTHNIKLILVEPYFDSKTPNSVAQAVGGEAIVLLPSVGGVPAVSTYFNLFDYDVNLPDCLDHGNRGFDARYLSFRPAGSADRCGHRVYIRIGIGSAGHRQGIADAK